MTRKKNSTKSKGKKQVNDDQLEALIHERTDVPCLHLGVTVECEGEDGERFGAWDKTLFLFRHKQKGLIPAAHRCLG